MSDGLFDQAASVEGAVTRPGQSTNGEMNRTEVRNGKRKRRRSRKRKSKSHASAPAIGEQAANGVICGHSELQQSSSHDGKASAPVARDPNGRERSGGSQAFGPADSTRHPTAQTGAVPRHGGKPDCANGEHGHRMTDEGARAARAGPGKDQPASPANGKRPDHRNRGNAAPDHETQCNGHAGLAGSKSPAGHSKNVSPDDRHRPAGDQKRDGGESKDRHRHPRRRSFGQPGSPTPRYAALDLGTNNCRLLVAEPREQGFRVVDAFSRIVRLGDGMASSGALCDDAMARAIEALKVCGRKLAENRVKKARLIATEACRYAQNGSAFLDTVESATGLKLEVVDRETEARLAVAGCASLVHPQASGVILFDIGGGSSELVWLDLRQRRHERGVALARFIRAWTSLPVGVVTLSERFGGVNVTPEIFDDMVDYVDDLMSESYDFDLLDKEFENKHIHLLGTSGTVTTLAGIHLNLPRYDRRRVDGLWMSNTDVVSMIDRLVAMNYHERVGNPCIGSDRADLVLAGCAIFEAFRRRWPCRRIRVADRGLREGILMEMMARDRVWARRGRGGGNRRPNQPPSAETNRNS